MDPGGSWLTLEELQLEHVQRVLVHTHGNRSEAARILGVSRTGLLGKIKRFGIDVPPEQGGQG
jgi:DNA-binding NtrC family response regulator